MSDLEERLAGEDREGLLEAFDLLFPLGLALGVGHDLFTPSSTERWNPPIKAIVRGTVVEDSIESKTDKKGEHLSAVGNA